MTAQSTDAPARTLTLADYRAETFESMIGGTITFNPVEIGPPAAAMKVLEVRRGTTSPLFERQQFSLLLSIKDQPPLAGCLYTIDRPGFAVEGILISRVFAPKYHRLDPEAMIYEAVFT